MTGLRLYLSDEVPQVKDVPISSDPLTATNVDDIMEKAEKLVGVKSRFLP